MTLYETLGIPKDATAADVKAAYRARSKSAHPDAGGTEEAFAALKLAYDILSDPIRRRRYDETGVVVETGADNQRAEILNYIGQKLVGILTSADDPTTVDVVARIKEIIAAEREAIKKDRGLAEARKKKFEQARARMSAKKGKRDVMGPMIDGQVQAMADHMAKADGALLALDEAERVVGEHKYKADQKPARATQGYGGMFGTVGGGGFWGGSGTR